MALLYPSAEDLRSWSLRLQHEANVEREATKRLATQYWNTDAGEPTAVAALWQAFVQADQVAQESRTRLIADAAAYEDWASGQAVLHTSSAPRLTPSHDTMGRPCTPPTTMEKVTHVLTWRTWPDLSAPSGIDPVLCAGACLRVGRHDALQLAVVRHVLAFFDSMASDGRLRLPQDLRI